MADAPIAIPVEFDLSGLDRLARVVTAEVTEAGHAVQAKLGASFKAAGDAAKSGMANATKAVKTTRDGVKAATDEIDAMGKGLKGLGEYAAIGVVGAIGSLYALDAAAVAALADLREVGLVDLVTADQVANVESLDAAVGGLTAGAEVATVALASALEPSIRSVTTRMIDLELFTAKVAHAFDVGALSIDSYGSLLLSLVLGPIKGFLDVEDAVLTAISGESEGRTALVKKVDDYAISVAASAFAVHTETEEQREAIAVNNSAADVIDRVADAHTKAAFAASEAGKAAVQAAKDAEAAEKKRAETVAKLFAVADDKTAEAKYQAEIAAHQRLLDLRKLYVAAVVKAREAEQADAKAVAATAEAVDGAVEAQTRAEAAAARWATTLGDMPQQVQTITDAFGAAAGGVSDLINTQIDYYKDLGKAGKEQARDLWVASQAVSVAQAVANGAVAVSQALAQLGPVAGPIAAGGIVATMIAGVISTIRSTAPEFDTGTGAALARTGQQDQFLATLYKGEGVLTRQGVDNVGGPAAVRAANAGTPMPQSAQPTTVSVVFRGRVVDRMVAEAAHMGGAFSAVLDSIASPPGVARVWR